MEAVNTLINDLRVAPYENRDTIKKELVALALGAKGSAVREHLHSVKRGELLELAAGRLHVLAYEHIRLPGPNSAMVQRICARKAPA